jgi:predicted transcriptional regulator
VARHFGLAISQITLFIFGGVAELKAEPARPKVEFYVAVVGPIVSACISLGMYMTHSLGQQLGWSVMVLAVISYLAMINMLLAIFNLIPAFPMDGGRILRSILWGWSNDFKWANRICVALGGGFGLGLIFLGLYSLILGHFFSGLWWMLIGWFLRQAAYASRTQFYVRQELSGAKVGKFMTKDPLCVPPDISLKECIENYVYQSHHHLYPVIQEGMLVGYISLREVKSIRPELWESTTVRNVMVPRAQFQVLSSDTSALEAVNLFPQSDRATLLVVEGNRLVGMLTFQDLFKLISIKLELEEQVRL